MARTNSAGLRVHKYLKSLCFCCVGWRAVVCGEHHQIVAALVAMMLQAGIHGSLQCGTACRPVHPELPVRRSSRTVTRAGPKTQQKQEQPANGTKPQVGFRCAALRIIL